MNRQFFQPLKLNCNVAPFLKDRRQFLLGHKVSSGKSDLDRFEEA